MAKAADFDVREATMDVARVAVQKGGYNALSYRDLAAEIGVKSATIHYHFPTKADLAEALVARYVEDFQKHMEPYLEKSFDEAIEAYLKLFKVAFDGTNRMCLGGMMSAEVSALLPPAREQIVRFAAGHIEWLKTVLAKKHRRLSAEALEDRARAILYALEGAMLMVRGQGGDDAAFDSVVGTYRATGLLA
jgi:TetR/AcrR family transcriptional repressor of nem operon